MPLDFQNYRLQVEEKQKFYALFFLEMWVSNKFKTFVLRSKLSVLYSRTFSNFSFTEEIHMSRK